MKTLIPLTLLLLLTGCVHGKHFDIETGIFLPNKPATNSMVLPAAPGNTHEGTNIVSAPLPPAPPQVSLFADAFDAPLTMSVAIQPDAVVGTPHWTVMTLAWDQYSMFAGNFLVILRSGSACGPWVLEQSFPLPNLLTCWTVSNAAPQQFYLLAVQ